MKIDLNDLYDGLNRDILFFKLDDLAYSISLVAEHLRSDIIERREYVERVRDNLKETFSRGPELFNFFLKRNLDYPLYLSRIEDYHKKGWKTESIMKELHKNIHSFKRGIIEELYPNQ